MAKAPRKASQSHVANVLCSLFKAPRSSNLEEVLASLDCLQNNIPWTPSSIMFYPFEANVFQDLGTPKRKMSDLMLELISFPGEVYLVRDSTRAGPDGLWCVTCERFEETDTLSHVAVSAKAQFFVNYAEDEDGDSYRIISILAKSLK